MFRNTFFIFFLVFSFSCYSQKKNNDNLDSIRKEILNEGLLLYRLEKASWIATDILLKDYTEISNKIEGYLSYVDNRNTKTIFWTNDNKILLSIEFDSIASIKNPRVDFITRLPLKKENELIALRKAAFNELAKNEGKFFSFYNNTGQNVIPIIGEKRLVFIMTGSQAQEIIVGNDYKLTFNDNNEIEEKEKLHNSLLRFDQSNKKQNEIGTFHTHLKAHPFMTSTDICTFLLFQDVFKIEKHTVVSDAYTSIFESSRALLIIVPILNHK
ncbi:MAG TPA: hypothetical protein VIM65_00490 [Cyclobacteriaceae bacterium]